MQRTSLFLLVVTLAGCVTVDVTRVGEPRPALPNSCPVRFEALTPQQAFASGEVEVGSGCAEGNGDGLDRRATDALTPQACALGGDLVIVTGTCLLPAGRSTSSGLQVMILAKSH